MIARITRILIFLQLATAAGLFILAVKVWHIDSVWLALILSIGAVFLFRILITANSFFLARHYASETPANHRIGWRQAWRLFIEEFNATMLATSWTMPFRSFAKRTSKNSIGLPVLLIHGWGCNSGYWHPLSKMLMQANISHHAIDLEPVLGDIDCYVPIVQRAVETLCRETGHDKIIIVAHSMGGLATRAYLRDHGGACIARAITLGTPHRGTSLANFGIGANCLQMGWTGSAKHGRPSEWLIQLEKTEDQAARALFVSLYSHHDNIIAPQTSACLAGASNVAFSGIGHVALALHPLIQARVLEEIRIASQQASNVPVKDLLVDPQSKIRA
jgi:triacylglycerol lipase